MLQQKMTSTGLKEWVVDSPLIQNVVPWAGKYPGRLQEELTAMQQEVLDRFIATITNEDGNDALLCPDCNDVFVFWNNDIRCVNCERGLNLPRGFQPKLVFLGQLPTPIGRVENGEIKGRPFLKDVFRRVEHMPDDVQRGLYQSYFFTVNNNIWFSPSIIGVFPDNWPRSRPSIFLRKEYFSILNIPATHIYGMVGDNYSLCNFASWRRSTMAHVLQQRIIPRIIIDVMFADLKAVGKMEVVLNRLAGTGGLGLLGMLGGGMYHVYNMIGRRGSERFQALYDEYITID